MKIAIVTDTYRPRVNGVVASIDTFANEYRKMGNEVMIVAPEYPVGQKDFKDAGNEQFVIRIKATPLFFDPEDSMAFPGSAEGRKVIKEKIIGHNFDIIHTQTPFALGIEAVKWAKQMKCPIVHTYHTMFESYIEHYIKFLPKTFAKWFSKAFSKWYCDKMDMNITPSSQMQELLKSYNVIPPVEVNPTGIKIEKFKVFNGDDFRKKNNIPKDTILFLFMGRIGHEKNIPFLFDVLKKVQAKMPGREIKLMVAGKGPAEEAVKAAAKEKGVEKDILWFGYFEPQDWVNCYAAADLFTFASITETQGLVVTEAMAVGTPVVAVGEMGVAEVMKGDKGGVLVDLNVDHFVDAVIKMLTDSKYYESKKKEAFDYAKEWSAEAMAKKLLDKFGRIIDAKKAAKK